MKKKVLLLFCVVLIIAVTRCKKEGSDSISCDTTGWVADSIRFSNTVEPIINQHCTSCHNNSLFQGNVNLTGYSNVKKYADNGKLLGTMGYLKGYKGMPEAGKIPQDKICKVKFWVDNGALNN